MESTPCDILYLSKAIESDEGGDTVELKMIAFGCDHGGVDLKDTLVGYLRSKGVDVRDFGTHGREAVGYPDFGKEVPYCVSASHAERGVMVCISGIGMSIIANKFLGARSSREHNDANILVLSGAKTEAILDWPNKLSSSGWQRRLQAAGTSVASTKSARSKATWHPSRHSGQIKK